MLQTLQKGEEPILHRWEHRPLGIRILTLVHESSVQWPIASYVVPRRQIHIEVLVEVHHIRIHIADELLVTINVLGSQSIELIADTLVGGHKVEDLVTEEKATIPATLDRCPR